MNSIPPANRSIAQRIIEYPGHLRNYVIWKTGFCRQLRKHDPIFVYQMGKVASRSICEPLQEVYPGRVVHAHRFDVDGHAGETMELLKYWRSDSPPAFMPIISLTRDPVDRNVSAFFQNFKLYTGVSPERSTHSMSELLDCFLEVFPHHIPLVWFDDKIKGEFGLDVFAHPVSPEGILTVEHQRTPLLVMRMEASDEIKSKAVQDFLHIPEFSVGHRNESGEKDYSSLYQQFKKEVRLPEEYVENMIESKYYRHFYGKDFEERTRRKWCAGPEM